MRVLLSPIGSRGDLQPLLVLGEELRRRGHEVSFATCPNFLGTLRAEGFDALPIGSDSNAMILEHAALAEQSPVTALPRQLRLLGDETARQCRDLLQAHLPRFDLIVATEVLEHYEDDVAALRLWRSRLAARGALLLSVPAFPERFGPWDVKAGHFRRYEREGLAAAFRAADFEPVAIRTYGFPLGNLLEAARDAVARRQPAEESMSERTAASGRLLQPSGATGVLTAAAGAVGGQLQRPFTGGRHGVGFVALARATD